MRESEAASSVRDDPRSSMREMGRRVAWGLLGCLSPFWLHNPSLSERLRILAYHGVPDRAAFRRQVEYLSERFTLVGPAQVKRFVKGGEVGARPCWVTFDDAHPSIVDVALEVLEEFSVPATLFVCPGLIDTEEPYWWEIVEEAVELDVSMDGQPLRTGEVGRLKTLPDPRRRVEVQRIRETLEIAMGREFHGEQMTSEHLRRWVEGGGSLGNHTWDHPTLDTCTVTEQRRQIEAAHEWLVDWLQGGPMCFAYPNGNVSAFSRSVLTELGYQLAVLFDHRLVETGSSPLVLSRIRADAREGVLPFTARVSGAHPFMHRLRHGRPEPGPTRPMDEE